MTSILLSVNGAQAWASTTGPLTSGMVGIPVTIKYDEAWDGLTKNLICRCSPWGSSNGEIRTLLNVGETSTVAHEVMQPDMYLYLGVEGFSDDGKLVIPTTWAMCGRVRHGANSTDDPSADPELSVWNQLQAEIQQIKQDAASGTVQNGGQVADHSRHVRAIAHRGYSAEAPENTIPAYILAKKMGFNYAECDVSFTKDGVAVLLHDSTIDRTSNGSGSISAMTYDEVLQYDFGSWKAPEYAGTKIPTFAEFIRLCRGIGLHPYIELKNNGGYSQEAVNGLVDTVRSCGMGGKVTWISYNSNFLGYVKAADSTARLGYLVDTISDDKAVAAVATIQSLRTEENEVIANLALAYLNDTRLRYFIDADIPVEAYYISTDATAVSEKILAASPYISGFTTDVCIAGKVLYDAYMQWTGEPGGGTGGDDSGGPDEGGDDSGSSGGDDPGDSGGDGGGSDGGDTPGEPDDGGSGGTETPGTLVHSWDFTQGLTDSVGGYTAEPSGATQDSSGLHLTAANNYVRLCDDIVKGDVVEVDVGDLNARDWGGKHGRLISFVDWDKGYESGTGQYGIVYRNTGEWNIYKNPWGTGGVLTAVDALANKTVRIDTGTGKAYADGVLFADNNGWRNDAYYLLLGASEQAYFDATIRAVRVYRPA